MREFSQMFRKELRIESTGLAIYTSLIIGLAFWAYYHSGAEDVIRLGILFMAPLIMLPFFALLRSVQNLKAEWNEDTVQWMFSLPVRGWTVLGAKSLAIIFQMVLLVVLMFVVSAPLIPREYFVISNISSLTRILIGFLIMLSTLIPVVQFSILVGRLSPIWKGVSGLVVFFGLNYVWVRIANLLSQVIPQVRVSTSAFILNGPEGPLELQSQFNAVPVFLQIFFAFLVMAAAVWVWEKRTDA